MELAFSDAERGFRDELARWLASALPAFENRPSFNHSQERAEFDRRWQRALFEGGWAGVSWPREFGGRGTTLVEQLIFHEELACRDAPPPGLNFVGLYHAGPTIMRAGTTAQQMRWLGPILSGDQFWCQGFSEPDAGSDLASIRTRGTVVGDTIVIDGRKTWTSNAHVTELCELLVRSDPEQTRHHGLTYVVCEMDRPGVEVRNVVQIDGAPEFNEVTFDAVELPLDNVLGGIGDGWNVAMTTLGYERGTAFIDREIRLRQRVRALASLLVSPSSPRRADDVGLLRQLGTASAEVEALRAQVYRMISELTAGASVGAETSMTKLYFSDLDQRIGRLGVDVLGSEALVYDADDPEATEAGAWMARYFRSYSSTIAAGTSQVQRNIVGERVLGLPRGSARA